MTHPTYTQPHYLMPFFGYDRLPEELANVSKPFGELASFIDTELSHENKCKEIALQKLLEAKDAAIRAALFDL